jgi:acyl carrier protein
MSHETDVTPPEASLDVLRGLAQVIHLVADTPLDDVKPDRLFVDELGIDSLAMVEILEGTAQHFNVRIEDEDAKDFIRVRDLTDYVAARLQLQAR